MLISLRSSFLIVLQITSQFCVDTISKIAYISHQIQLAPISGSMLLWPLERFMQTHVIALYLMFWSCAVEVPMVTWYPNMGSFRV